ncbi:MAG: barstar family protein [Eubacteriales bacterium]|nr:barstar family protein [Eubacteriales bacterium]
MLHIKLDLTPFEEKISLHRYLKEALGFPFYYGANLDALHDELASEMADTEITLMLPKNPKGKMAEYMPRLRRVFEETAEENYHLTVCVEEA